MKLQGTERVGKRRQKCGTDEGRVLWHIAVTSFGAVHREVCMGTGGKRSPGLTGSKWGLIKSA